MKPILILASLIMLTSEVKTQGSFLVNGSFESAGPGGGGAGSGRFVYVSGLHDTQIAGWVLAGSGDVYLHQSPDIGNAIGANFNSAQSGSNYLDLSGGIGGGTSGIHATIYQDFPTLVSQTYELSFFIGAAFSPSATINVQIDGMISLLNQTLTASVPSGNIQWMERRFTFIADSTTTRLSFRDVSGNDDNVSFVDNVAVNQLSAVAAPAPGSMLIAAAGFSLLASQIARRKKLNSLAMDDPVAASVSD